MLQGLETDAAQAGAYWFGLAIEAFLQSHKVK
jgi:hypothetical protein